jgi:hypothetical protein
MIDHGIKNFNICKTCNDGVFVEEYRSKINYYCGNEDEKAWSTDKDRRQKMVEGARKRLQYEEYNLQLTVSKVGDFLVLGNDEDKSWAIIDIIEKLKLQDGDRIKVKKI